MRRFVTKYVKSCLRCGFAKGTYGRGEGLLHPIKRRPVPFDTVHIDHLGPFVRSVRGHSYLLMVVDGFTKFVLAKPCRTLKSSEAISRLAEIFSEFGYPRRVISDQGKAFKSKEFKAFLAEKGVRHVMNAVATPRANGQVERPNRTIVEALSSTAETEGRWDELLPDIVWGLNNTVNAGTRFSPADLMFSHSRGRVADLADGELASDGGDQRNTETVPQATADGLGCTAVVNKPYVDGGSSSRDMADISAAEGAKDEATVIPKHQKQQGDDSAHASQSVGDPSQSRAIPRRSERLLRRKNPTEPTNSRTEDQSYPEVCEPGAVASANNERSHSGSKKIRRYRAQAMEHINEAGERMKRRFDKRRKTATSYKVGDLVLWRNSAALKPGVGLSRKLVNKFDGPYRVTKVLLNDRYRIEAITGMRGYKRFMAIVAVDSLRRYHGVNDVEYESDSDGENCEDDWE